tara:strand:+ start:1067 stop:1273 length:207 start_codon:yes stop_codon:yes gene_type:complete
MKKIRAIAILDLDIEGGYREAADVEDNLIKLIQEYTAEMKNVIHFQVEVRDRRGSNKVDLSKMKFRSN